MHFTRTKTLRGYPKGELSFFLPTQQSYNLGSKH